MAFTVSAGLALVEGELSRIGLLMQHDSALPSVSTLLAGEPIRGSWWGHPLGKHIYELLTVFESGAGQLSLKLVAGKITYVDVALWPSFLALRALAAKRLARSLSQPAQALHAHIEQHGQAQLDELARSGFAPSKALGESARELEASWLAHAGSVHTPSGAHAKLLSSWERWSDEHAPRTTLPTPAQARSALELAVQRLSAGAARAPKVALLDAL